MLFVGALSFQALAADVFVQVAPPRVRVEHRPPRPERGYIWTPGYYRWDGRSHLWVDGRWERPPHPHARWEQHRWVRRNGGWVFVEGHWR